MSKGKEVFQYTLKGEYLRKYKSLAEASREVGLKGTSPIRKAINNNTIQSKGFMWTDVFSETIGEFIGRNRNQTKVEVGDIFHSENYGEYKVTAYHHTEANGSKNYEIVFTNTGRTSVARDVAIIKGKIKDYFQPRLDGVGYIGELKKIMSDPSDTREYSVWRGMISRCYDKAYRDYKFYGARGVFVSKRWHNFSNFYEDIKSLEGYDEELFNKNKIHLDKDYKAKNGEEKIYSFETCVFLTPQKNGALARDSSLIGFSALSPKGEYFGYERNLKKFCDKNKITSAHARYIIAGKGYSAHGWAFGNPHEDIESLKKKLSQRKIQKNNRKFMAISPEGKEYIRTKVSSFCDEFKFTKAQAKHVYDVLNGKRNMVNGWKFENIGEDENV